MSNWFSKQAVGTRLALIVGLIIIVFSAINLAWFYHKATKQAEEKSVAIANSVSETVLSALNNLMVQGNMDERGDLVKLLQATTSGLADLRVFRSTSVTEQFGSGLPGEQPQDEMEREVLNSGKQEWQVVEQNGIRYLRVVTPFLISSNHGGINCMDCHDGKEGAVNGGISALISMEKSDADLQSNLWQMVLFSLARLVIMIGLVLLAISKTLNRVLMRLTGHLRENASQLDTSSDHLSTASQSLAEAATEQAASLEETSATLASLAETANLNATDADSANRLMSEVNGLVNEGKQSMAETVEAMRQISSSSKEISKIIKVIEEIAFQTNLLALNAAVEAARAGEHGKGFAVVAEEVRNLAGRSASALKDTTALIEGAARYSKDGADLVNNMAEFLDKIAIAAGKVNESVKSIADKSHDQALGVEQIETAVSQMDKVTQSNAAQAEETSADTESLSAQAEVLQEIIGELDALIHGQKSNGYANADVKALKAPGRTSQR